MHTCARQQYATASPPPFQLKSSLAGLRSIRCCARWARNKVERRSRCHYQFRQVIFAALIVWTDPILRRFDLRTVTGAFNALVAKHGPELGCVEPASPCNGRNNEGRMQSKWYIAVKCLLESMQFTYCATVGLQKLHCAVLWSTIQHAWALAQVTVGGNESRRKKWLNAIVEMNDPYKLCQ